MSMTTEQLANHIEKLLEQFDKRFEVRFNGVEDRLQKIETVTEGAIKSTKELEIWKAGVEGMAKGGRLVWVIAASIGSSALTIIGMTILR